MHRLIHVGNLLWVHTYTERAVFFRDGRPFTGEIFKMLCIQGGTKHSKSNSSRINFLDLHQIVIESMQNYDFDILV